MEDLADLLLNKLNKDFDTWAKKPWGNTPGITTGELVYRIIEDNGATLPIYRVFPEVGEQTLIRALRRVFPEIRLNGGNETWFYKLLSLIDYKQCNKCKVPKKYSEFCKDNHSSDGVYRICKLCRKPVQNAYYKANLKYFKEYLKHNRKAFTARNAYRRARKIKATPSWANSFKIKEIYSTCPERHVVDHIYPLISDWVCGLHVENNLQIITKQENSEKGNRRYIKYHG